MAGFAYLQLGSLLGLIAFLKSIIPREAWMLLDSLWGKVFSKISFYTHVNVHQIHGGYENEVYDDMEIFVASLSSCDSSTARRLDVFRVQKAAAANYGLSNGESIVDEFQGGKFWWVHFVKNKDYKTWSNSRYIEEKRYYTVTFHKSHRHILFPKYLEHIRERAAILRHETKEKQLFTNAKTGDSHKRKPWKSVAFKHPSTFESLALKPEFKRQITDDLDAFMNGKEFYERVGRAWKRGYLLYGPPGTGKSSMIAAIANYTGFDVYDMELTEVSSNAELRTLLMQVQSKSIIVIEDIDCTIELKKRGKAAGDNDDDEDENARKNDDSNKKKKKEDETPPSRMTLSGLLNFTDGLWSCCGDQRIIIFTTNFIDKIDIALVRPGRMDMHIHLSYCTYEAFKVLAWTHLRIRREDQDALFWDIRELFDDEAIQITPAAVAEIFVQNRTRDPDIALRCLIKEMQQKKNAAQEP